MSEKSQASNNEDFTVNDETNMAFKSQSFGILKEK
jgi:hypothetical protein